MKVHKPACAIRDRLDKSLLEKSVLCGIPSAGANGGVGAQLEGVH